jgi:hypothetical protein
MKDLETLGEDLLTDLLGAHNLHLQVYIGTFPDFNKKTVKPILIFFNKYNYSLCRRTGRSG